MSINTNNDHNSSGNNSWLEKDDSPSSESVIMVEDLEWEEWDGVSPFWHHCIAGSLAGVAEHVLFYPVDTVKTHMQSYCDNCPHNSNNNNNNNNNRHHNKAIGNNISSFRTNPTGGMWSTMRSLMQTGHVVGGTQSNGTGTTNTTTTKTKTATTTATTAVSGQRPATTLVAPICEKKKINIHGFGRLWRGVQTMAVGCVPAHALYFSMYELVKPYNAGLAGAIAALGHDMVMTPLDTVKQRLQLGHYRGDMTHAFRTIYQQEGWLGLYRSFPITVLTNVPYGILMVSTNEYLRHYLSSSNYNGQNSQNLDLTSTTIAGCGAGAVASALTTPLDCIKTRLQTQRLLAMSIQETSVLKTTTSCPSATSTCESLLQATKPKYTTVPDAIRVIFKEDGIAGFYRGITPRVLTHTPAVAISWTTYEMAKSWLAQTTNYLNNYNIHNPHL